MKSFIYGSLSALLAGFDLYVKKFVEEHVEDSEEELVCRDKVVIRKVYNKGFALNKGDKYPKFVKTISAGVLGIIVAFAVGIWKRSNCICEKMAVAFVLSGGISNTYERWKKGYVVDYFGFQTKWKKFNRITFNLGDLLIFAGGIILIWKEIMKGNR